MRGKKAIQINYFLFFFPLIKDDITNYSKEELKIKTKYHKILLLLSCFCVSTKSYACLRTPLACVIKSLQAITKETIRYIIKITS